MGTTKSHDGKILNLAVSSTINSGDPLVIGDIHGVALTDYNSVSGKAAVDVEGVHDLSVTGSDATGDVAGEVGDPVYINPSTFALTHDSTQKFFGHLLEATTLGAAATVNVRVQQAPGGRGELITLETFETSPVCCAAGGGAAAGTDTVTNIAAFENNIFEYYNIGTQTLLGPTVAADGLLASLDLTNNEGVEYTQGITARSKSAFVIGTSPAFYAKIGLKVADVSGSDICAFGFRKAAAYSSVYANYTDKAALNKIAGDIYTSTALNNGADVETDTTDNLADGGSVVLEVYVSAAGVVTYKIDGAAPTVTAAFTFDDGDTVIPFLHILHDATTPGAIHITAWEVGLQ